MSENQDAEAYVKKADESLAGAQSEYDNGRFNNRANRAYYAVCQTAVAALLRNGIQRKDETWPHTFVQSEFVGKLVNRRHRYPARLRDTLAELQRYRHRADYRGISITRADANIAVRRCHEFVEIVRLESERQ